MNFVAGLLLMYLPERHAFGGLVVLMQDRGLRKYYSVDMSLLQVSYSSIVIQQLRWPSILSFTGAISLSQDRHDQHFLQLPSLRARCCDSVLYTNADPIISMLLLRTFNTFAWQTHLWQLGRLMPQRLCAHLEACGVLPLLYGASWLMTCFSADFPASFSAR